MLDVIFLTSVTAVYIHLTWSLYPYMLIFMFNISPFYRTWCFYMKKNFKRIEELISYNFNNFAVKNCKSVSCNEIEGLVLFPKVLRNLNCEAYWFCCLLIRRDWNQKYLLINLFSPWQNYVDNTVMSQFVIIALICNDCPNL